MSNNTATSNTCSCASCAGAACTCGCQPIQNLRRAGCRCGESCACGSGCNCPR